MNSVQVKFHAAVIGVTTFLFFSLYEASQLLISISVLEEINIYVLISGKLLISSLISLTFYRWVAIFLLWLSKKNSSVKKFFLGPNYLEGTWAGFYTNTNGDSKLFIERYEQTIFELIVRGKSYTKDLSYHTTWVSNPVLINPKMGVISYMYKTKSIDEISDGNGVAFFDLRRNGIEAEAFEYSGFSSDLENLGRNKSLGVKINSEYNISDEDALKFALETYRERHNSF